MKKKGPVSRWKRREEWRGMISNQPTIGQGISAYCREGGLSTKSFYLWRKRLGKEPGPGGFIHVESAGGREANVLRIRTPGGYELEIPWGSDGECVKTILTVLAGAG